MYYGHLLESLKKYDDAVVQYEKAVKMDPTKTDLYKNISSAYEQKNDYKKAISAYQKYYASLDKEKQTPDLQFQVGRLYYGAGTQPDSLTITVEERKQALMSADSVFHAIAEAAPDSYLGNFWRARANSALDLKPLKDLRNLSMRKWPLYWKAKTILITIQLWLNATVILDITIC